MSTRRRNESRPSGIHPPRSTQERRDDVNRDKLEMVLDWAFRPGQWAARSAYALGLQGGPSLHVDHREIVVPNQRVTPLRIVFASDFHAGATTDHRILASACSQISVLRPDLILLGGDFISVRANAIHPLAAMLADLQCPLGKFGVFGNHDMRANLPVLRDALTAAGVRMLENEIVRLPDPHGDVSVIGLDDPIVGSPDGSLLHNAGDVRILLMHAPDGLLAAGDRHFDLALCGHTHGGQIVLPGGIIPYLPHGELSRKFPVGPYELGDSRTLIVSRGVGCSTVPLRLGCQAEVHLITLR